MRSKNCICGMLCSPTCNECFRRLRRMSKGSEDDDDSYDGRQKDRAQLPQIPPSAYEFGRMLLDRISPEDVAT